MLGIVIEPNSQPATSSGGGGWRRHRPIGRSLQELGFPAIKRKHPGGDAAAELLGEGSSPRDQLGRGRGAARWLEERDTIGGEHTLFPCAWRIVAHAASDRAKAREIGGDSSAASRCKSMIWGRMRFSLPTTADSSIRPRLAKARPKGPGPAASGLVAWSSGSARAAGVARPASRGASSGGISARQRLA